MTRRKAVALPPPPPPPAEFTLTGFYEKNTKNAISSHLRETPAAFNGYFLLYRYEVTVRRVEESKEVLGERLLRLWEDQPSNHHHTNGFRALALQLGVTLDPGMRAINAPKDQT